MHLLALTEYEAHTEAGTWYKVQLTWLLFYIFVGVLHQ